MPKNKTREWYDGYMANESCNHCGESDSCCLDWHHERDKEYKVSTLVGGRYSKKKILAEIEKCICLCCNCHRRLHHKERND